MMPLAFEKTPMKFFRSIAVPLFNSYQLYKQDDMEAAMQAAWECHASDWRSAARWWLANIQHNRSKR